MSRLHKTNDRNSFNMTATNTGKNFLVISILLGCCYDRACFALRKSYGAGVSVTSMFQDPKGIKQSGKAFLGVSLARNYGNIGHPDSENLQDAFDLNEVADREYEHIVALNDDGWLIGGGEAGPYNLAAADSAHITLMDIGTFDEHLARHNEVCSFGQRLEMMFT